jgi:hypothetical protein
MLARAQTIRVDTLVLATASILPRNDSNQLGDGIEATAAHLRVLSYFLAIDLTSYAK